MGRAIYRGTPLPSLGAIFCLALSLLSSVSALAQSKPFNLATDTSNVSIIGHADYLDDDGGALTFGEVSVPSFSSRFAPLTHDNAYRGFALDPRWIRFTIANSHDKAIGYNVIYPDPFLDTLSFYSSVNGAEPEETTLLLADHFASRQVNYRLFTIKRAAPPHSQTDIYIRIDNIASKISFSDIKIYATAPFEKMRNIENILLGLFYGGMAFMCIYNIFIFFSVKDISYLYYVIYILFTILTWASLNGLGHQFLWPASADDMKAVNMLFPTGAYFFAVMFTRAFLQTANRHPTIDKILLGFSSLCVINTLTVFANMILVSIVLNQITGIVAILFIVIGVYVWREGYRPAIYYAYAWVCVTFGSAIYAMVYAGVFPMNLATAWSGMAGAAIEVMLLSFALGYRIRILREEKMEAQRLYQETLEKAKEELEVKVIERTAELNEQKEMAENATRLKDKFVSIVSHDLRSPLGSMIGLTQILEQDAGSSFTDYQKDIVKRMTDVAGGLVNMIDKLLNISRLQTGKLKPHSMATDANSISRLTIAKLEQIASRKGISLVNEIKPDTMIFADSELMGEVVGNLVSNAIKFCHSGDTITIFTPPERNTTIAVRDTGVGVREDLMANIFKHEVKTTTNGTAGERGTGLGLPFCKDIMEAHNGTLTLESEHGKGSTFYAQLPS